MGKIKFVKTGSTTPKRKPSAGERLIKSAKEMRTIVKRKAAKK